MSTPTDQEQVSKLMLENGALEKRLDELEYRLKQHCELLAKLKSLVAQLEETTR